MSFLLIWDIDGTLIQGKGIGRRTMDMAFYELFGINEAFKGIPMAGRLDAVIVKEAFSFFELDHKAAAKFFDIYCEILSQEVCKLDWSMACPGIPALLEMLKSKDIFYNVLGTGNIERAARIKLSADGLNRFFPTGGFGDEAIERWQLIQKAVANSQEHFKTEFTGETIYIIGDTPRDIECGRILNVKTVGVATGPYSCRELEACGADYVFGDLTDASAFLRIFEMD